MVAKENKAVNRVSPELKKAIKEFLAAKLSVTEVATKLNIPYQTVYHYSKLNKARKSKTKVTASSVIEEKIEQLEAEKAKLELQISTLRELL